VVLTNSGGIQDETCTLHVPCVTLRETTERPETIQVGANWLAGTDSVSILWAVNKMSNKLHSWPNPYGDRTAGEKIIDIISDS